MNTITAKFGVAAMIGLVGLLVVLPVFAIDATPPGKLRRAAQKQTNKTTIVNGKITTIANTDIPATVALSGEDGGEFTVSVSEKTQLRRKFWGKAEWEEFEVGDSVRVIGKWTDEGLTKIDARLLRDLSSQMREGVFVGEVTSLTTSGWVMRTVHHGDLTGAVEPTTKFVNRLQRTIVEEDISVGHRVRVRGLWSKRTATISEAINVKDYSLPKVVEKSAASESAVPE